jgi:hypothetical protein
VTYLVQFRIVKVPSPDTPPELWSSATSVNTSFEASIPYEADGDEGANLAGALIMRYKLDQLTAAAAAHDQPWPFEEGHEIDARLLPPALTAFRHRLVQVLRSQLEAAPAFTIEDLLGNDEAMETLAAAILAAPLARPEDD